MTTELQKELAQIESEIAEVEAAIKRNNGSDRDSAALKALCDRSEELGERRYQIRRQMRTQGKRNA